MKTNRNAATTAIRAALVLLMVASNAAPRGPQNSRGNGGPSGARSSAAPSRPAMQQHSAPGGGSRPMPHAQPGNHTASRPNPGMQPGSHTGSRPNPGMQPGNHTGSRGPMTSHNPGRGNNGGYGPGARVDNFNRANHGGYGQRGSYAHSQSFRSHGRDYVTRSYYHGGRSYTHVYRPYMWHGYRFAAYSPAYFYTPYFYGWAYNPWVVPVHYRWGWYGSPWLSYYGGYFSPYAVYGSASLWLTDYVMADALQTAYQEAAANGQLGQAGPQYGLNPIVKSAIADEIRSQIAIERAEANGYAASAPSFLDGRAHSFVVSASMNTDQGCPVTPGDVLQIGGAAVNGDRATVQVLASKGSDCQVGSFVSLPIDQLQEMQNHLRATLDQGLSDLRNRQGQGGLPAAPVAALAAPVPAPFASEMPAGM